MKTPAQNLAALALILLPPVAGAQGLEGRQLAAVDAGESLLSSTLGGIFTRDRDKISGSIDGVRVTLENARTLEVEVAYRGFDGAEIRVRVMDGDGRRVRQIPPARLLPPGGQGEGPHTATLVFELAAGTPEGFEARSTRLRFEAMKRGRPFVQYQRTYALDKLWSTEVSPENLRVRVTPEPIGGTAAWVARLGTWRPRPLPGSATFGDDHGFLRPQSVPFESRDARSGRRAAPETTVAVRGQATPPASRSRDLATARTISTANETAIRRLPATRERVAVRDFRFKTATTVAPTSTLPTHQVSASYLDLLGALELDDVDVEPSEILGVFSHVYPDKNPRSGVYYYIPRSYRLSYDADLGGAKGLGFRIAYDRRRGDGDGTVRMAVSLDSAVDLRELRLAEKILSEAARRDPGLTFRELKAFPLAAPPQFDFSGGLAGRVPGEDVAIVALSDTLEGIDVSWSTDPVTAQNIRRDLRDGTPISGVAAFDAPNSDAPRLIVPVRVELVDPAVYRAVDWSRTEEIRNRSPLPVILKHLHAIVIENGRPRLYSWDLGGAVLPPRARLDLDLRHVPEAVDSRAERLWIQYSLDRGCETCIDRVVDEILSADLWPDTGRINIRTLTPLAATGAAEIWLDVRSRFFEPEDRDLRDGPRQFLTEDRQVHAIDPIFLTRREPPEGGEPWPLFEYRLTLVMPDGAIHEGETWLASDHETIVIGPVQLEQSIGPLPAGG